MKHFNLIMFIGLIICIILLALEIDKLDNQIKDLKSLDNNPIIMMETGTVYTEHSEIVVFDTDSLDIIERSK